MEIKNQNIDIKAIPLEQRINIIRANVGRLVPQKHSPNVKYKYNKLSDIYEMILPICSELGVNLRVVGETATRHYENGDPMYYDSYRQKTQNGERTVWVYEADLTLAWINVHMPSERQDVTIHAVGTNDAGPDKAKGSAWTYAIKYYLFEDLSIDQGEDDPDNSSGMGPDPRATASNQNPPPPMQSFPSAPPPIPTLETPQRSKEEFTKFSKAMDTVNALVASIGTVADLNAKMAEFKAIDHALDSNMRCAVIWNRKVKELNAQWNDDLKLYC